MKILSSSNLYLEFNSNNKYDLYINKIYNIFNKKLKKKYLMHTSWSNQNILFNIVSIFIYKIIK